MSGSVARSGTRSLEPTAVVGNEGESGPGSTPAPQTHGVNMTAVAAKSDGVGILVVEWQGSTGNKKRVLGNEILRLLKPTLKGVVKRFLNRGVQADDLEQVAALAVSRLMSKPVRTDYTFAEIVYLRARDALKEHVAMHGADVHVSDWKRRSRAAVDGVETVNRGKSDESVSVNAQTSTDVSVYAAEPTNQDDQIDADSIVPLLARLSPSKREILKRLFGIDTPETSIRGLEDVLGVSRVRLTRLRDEALAELRAFMESEPA